MSIESELPRGGRIRQLQWLVASLLFAAIATACSNLVFFYRVARWEPFSLEIIKLVIVAVVVWTISQSFHPRSEDEISHNRNVLALRMSGLALLISFLTDMAFILYLR